MPEAKTYYKRFRQHMRMKKYIEHQNKSQTGKTEKSKPTTKRYKCKNCNYEMYYEAKRCPSCEKKGTIEESD